MREYTITLRCAFDDEEKHNLIMGAAKSAAKHLYTTALLIQDKRRPQIALHSSDFFASVEQINLADDIETDVTQEVTDA